MFSFESCELQGIVRRRGGGRQEGGDANGGTRSEKRTEPGKGREGRGGELTTITD